MALGTVMIVVQGGGLNRGERIVLSHFYRRIGVAVGMRVYLTTVRMEVNVVGSLSIRASGLDDP